VSVILNVLWFIFGGWISALAWMVAALVFAVTVIGLPFAPAALRLALFSAAPFGRHVVDDDQRRDLNLILNLVWVIFAGWWLALHHLILAVLLAITILGIPFAIQHLKLASLSLAPVGKMVID
jgi:uncharacterized membrane protein YccF (DUF307 family)